MLETSAEDHYFRQIKGRAYALFLFAAWMFYETWIKH